MYANLHVLPDLERDVLVQARAVRHAVDVLQALALCDLVRIATAPGAAVGIVGGDLDALEAGHGAEAGGGHGEAARVVVVARGRVGGAREGAQVEDAPEEGPAIWNVGDEDGGARFADVPEGPYGAEGFSEGVVFV